MDLKSNNPFWLIKDGLLNNYGSLHENISCEVLIVGGGITGSVIAHQCIKDGYNTVLIDKRKIGFGSTSATTAMLQYEIDIPLYKLSSKIGKTAAIACYSACSKSIDTLKDITNEINSKAGFKKKKSLYFASFKKDVDQLKKEYEARKNAGFEVSWLTPSQIKASFNLEKTHGGILSEQGGSMDAYMFAHEILQFNSKKGLRIYNNTELVNVETEAGSNKVTLNTGIQINAKKVIYCIGYESASLIPEKFVNLISTYATVSEVSKRAYKKYDDLLIWNTADPYLYMRTTDDGRFLIGGQDEPFRAPQKRDKLIRKKEQRLTDQFHKHFPNLDFFPDITWAGTFGETKDGLPYIGEHKGFKNSYFVLGFGGNGITFSVTGMEMVSSWLSKRKHPLAKWFSFGR